MSEPHVSDSTDQSYDVIIAGAGPVGLTAALVLGQAGRRVLVLETDAAPPTQWRASTFHPPTLELAEHLGFVDDMMAQGLVAPTFQLRERAGGLIAELDFSDLSDVTRYPFRLQLEQYKYVRILLEKLTRLDSVEVRYGHEAIYHLATGRDSVQVRVSGPAGRYTVAGNYLIGADGARSRLREHLDIEFQGTTYEHRYLLLGIDAPLEEYLPGIAHVNYLADPREHMMLLRTPDCWRVMFEVKPGLSDDEVASDEFITQRLQALVAPHPLPRVLSRQVYRVHQRVAEEFRRGPVMLIGDAAHVNSPLGGMGLNSGIHDAYTLAHVLVEARPLDLLDAWAAERRKVAVSEIQRLTDRNTKDLSVGEEEASDTRLAELRAISLEPGRTREWLLEASMIASAREQKLVPEHLLSTADVPVAIP